MKTPPAYFEPARMEAAHQWRQLEENPKLAGPWRLLFKQVCQPRHVLSELLQNADDAGATTASASVADGAFLFEHNGADFRAGDFASLCMFCHSNKRALHTIGFRGIGFKSTFSLGDSVELRTPTLGVRFRAERFTEPEWLGDPVEDSRTTIRIPLKSPALLSLVEQDFDRWLASPLSLLFLRNVRRVEIGGRVIEWQNQGHGPVPGSEWLSLGQGRAASLLSVRSQSQAFPREALEEIKEERGLADTELEGFPACQVEVVLGAEGSLFAVLPTGVATGLPFACNAPFMQDPARHGIKDPRVSPVNRWLLERLGELAGSALVTWLSNAALDEQRRADCYGLLPDVNARGKSLGDLCGQIVQGAALGVLRDKPLLLADGGDVHNAEECVALPPELLDAWPAGEAAQNLGEGGQVALSRYVAARDREKLARHRMLHVVGMADILYALQCRYLPRPATWPQMAVLWAFLAPQIVGYDRPYTGRVDQLRIVPVRGESTLQSARDAVRVGEKKELSAEEDWEFLSHQLQVVEPGWLRYLGSPKRAGDKEKEASPEVSRLEAARAVLLELELDHATDIDDVLERAASRLLEQASVGPSDWVRLAHIAARLGVSAGPSFQFVSRDGARHGRGCVLSDDNGLEDLVPTGLRDSLLLHPAYTKRSTSCSREEWRQWASSGRAGLLTFLPLEEVRTDVYGKTKLEAEARRRGHAGELLYHGVGRHFAIEDWDFDDAVWSLWEGLAAEDNRIWERVLRGILAQREDQWARGKSARFLQQGTRRDAVVSTDPVAPRWVMRLRGLPCLPDTHGALHVPQDLLRLTAETEAFADVEPFVHRSLDTEASRTLLDLLGVGTQPAGPERLLVRLRALAGSADVPAGEVEKWYRRLDLLAASCPTKDVSAIRRAFAEERLILTEHSGWTTAGGVFLSADENAAPDAPLIRAGVRDLALWARVGVAQQPTADLAIAWLQGLSTGALPPEELRRVRALIVRHPLRVWSECERWPNLAGEWVSVADLKYALTAQCRIPWAHLHPWVKQATADLRGIASAVVGEPPFASIPILASQIEERPESAGSSDGGRVVEWLCEAGAMLRRVTLADSEKAAAVQRKGAALETTRWNVVSELLITPYIAGTPAGTSRTADVVWTGAALLVTELPSPKLARRVPEEIGRAFGRDDIAAALHYSYERAPHDVRAYFEENFSLAEEPAEPPAGDGVPTAQEPVPSRNPHPRETSLQAAGTGDEGAEVKPPDEALASSEGTELRRSQPLAETPATGLPGPRRGGGESAPQVDEAVGDPRERQRSTTDRMPAREPSLAETGSPPERRRGPALLEPALPSIMERFASSAGSRQDGRERFAGADGSWLEKTRDGERFPWVKRSRTGEPLRYYWPIDHCLEAKPLEIEADVWSLLDQRSDLYALVLADARGRALEVTGSQLRELRDRGEITLHPATYRIVYGHARDA